VQELVKLLHAHPHWSPGKLLDLMDRREPERRLPAVSTASEILPRAGLIKPRRHHRRAHPGCPKSITQGPNDIWAADNKGQFRLKDGNYCFPLTVSDLASRYVLVCGAHLAISLEKSFKHFTQLFEAYGLPNRIQTDNGVPFASNALARLSQLSVWFIKLGIYPELQSPALFAGIEPGKPQQNGVYERMNRTLIAKHPVRKQEATILPASSLRGQQRKFDRFLEEFNQERPHEAIGMKRPAEIDQSSNLTMPKQIGRYDYPAHYLVRRVSRGGTIRGFNNQFFVSNALQEDYVGLEEVDDGVYDLYFCFCQIGRYELRSNKIQDIVSKVGLSRRQVDHASRV